jgi:hypothetical protein
VLQHIAEAQLRHFALKGLRRLLETPFEVGSLTLRIIQLLFKLKLPTAMLGVSPLGRFLHGSLCASQDFLLLSLRFRLPRGAELALDLLGERSRDWDPLAAMWAFHVLFHDVLPLF